MDGNIPSSMRVFLPGYCDSMQEQADCLHSVIPQLLTPGKVKVNDPSIPSAPTHLKSNARGPER